MEVRYTMTLDDLVRANRYALLRRTDFWLAQVLTSFGVVLLAVTAIDLLNGQRLPAVHWWWLPFAALIVALQTAMIARTLKQQFTSIPGIEGGTWLRITPAGIEERTPLSDEMQMWPRVKTIASTQHGIYFFAMGNHCYLAPCHAFATPADADAFATLAQSYWQAARERTGATPNGPPPRDRDHTA